MLKVLGLILAVAWFANCDKIYINVITPDKGPAYGNTRVLVRGKGLEANTAHIHPVCRFGTNDKVVKGIYVKCTPEPQGIREYEPTTEEKTADCIQCDPAPSSDFIDLVPFSVSIKGDFSDCQNSVDYRYYVPPHVDRIYPHYGPKNGGTNVTVYGSEFIDFDQNLRCSFGTVQVAATFLSSTMLRCKAPYSEVTQAAMPFRISLNNQQTTLERVFYWYYPDPQVDRLLPNRGPTTGGTHVIFEGAHYDPFNDMLDEVNSHNDTYCIFESHITPAKIINDNQLECIAPPSPVVRSVVTEVTLNNADLVLNPHDWTDDGVLYYYYAPPYVFDAFPLVGPTSGGTQVIVIGSNYLNTGTIKCKFGDKQVNGTFIDVNHILCVAPPVEFPGKVPLTVALEGDNFSSQTVWYLYYETPFVDEIWPKSGPFTGFTQITVKGKNFVHTGIGLVKCIFNDIYTPATIMSESEIKCDSPNILHNTSYDQWNARLPVWITLNNRDKSNTKDGQPILFGYYQWHNLSKIFPDAGPLEGGTNVSIIGSVFDQQNVYNVTARFGTTEVIASNWNSTHAFFTTPPIPCADDVIVEVSLNGQQYVKYDETITRGYIGIRSLDFNYYSNPKIYSFRPIQGPSCGNSTVTISGNGFEQARTKNVYVQFRNISWPHNVIGHAQVDSFDNHVVKVLTPAAPPETVTHVYFSMNDQNWIQAKQKQKNGINTYTYYKSPHVHTLEPKYGPVHSQNERNISIVGTGFICPVEGCGDAKCRYGDKKRMFIYTKAYIENEEHVKCQLPDISRPGTMTVEVSNNGIDYTHDKNNFTYYDAFNLNTLPIIASRDGSTILHVLGFGYANTEKELKCQFKAANGRHITCPTIDCIVQARYVNDSAIECPTFKYADIVYTESQKELQEDDLEVEVAIRNNDFTHNHLRFFYIIPPGFGKPDPDFSIANGGAFVVIPADFYFTYTDDKGEEIKGNDYEKFIKNADPYVLLTGKNHQTIVKASIITSPIGSGGKENAIAFYSPQWPNAELITLNLTVSFDDWKQGSWPFTYYEEMKITKIHPKGGHTQGHTRVEISGSGFNNNLQMHIKWGDNCLVPSAESLAFHDKNTLIAYSAPCTQNVTHGGFSFIEIGINDEHLEILDHQRSLTETVLLNDFGEYTNDQNVYHYYKRPVVVHIFPHGGPNTGGTRLLVEGAWFYKFPHLDIYPRCRFGGVLVDAIWIDTVRLECLSPAMPGKDLQVQFAVTLNGVDFSEEYHLFTIYRPFKIYSLSPNAGPSYGGTNIVLVGANYTGYARTDEVKCRFSAIDLDIPDKLIPGNYLNETAILCTSPGGWGSGTGAKISLTFNLRNYEECSEPFTFFQVDEVYPRSGPATGSPKGIEVRGSGFTKNKNAACFIDNVRYEPFETTWNKLKCPLPPAKNGPDWFGNVNLEITMNGVDFKKFPRGFQYYPQITVEDIEPNTGPISGGSIINIYGVGFRNDYELVKLSCSIGQYIGSAILISSQQIECTTPDLRWEKGDFSKHDVQNVSASLNGWDFVGNFDYKLYGVNQMTPSSGPISGGTMITFNGYGFKHEKDFENGEAKCRFGIAPNYRVVKATVVGDDSMTCLVPRDFEMPLGSELPLDIPVEVSFADSKFNPWTSSVDKYRLYRQPNVINYFPKASYVADKKIVTLIASEDAPFFPPLPIWPNNKANIQCRFGKDVVPAAYLNYTTIQCVTPTINKDPSDVYEDTVDLSVSMNEEDFGYVGDYTFTGDATGIWNILLWIGGTVLAGVIICLLLAVCANCWKWVGKIRPGEAGRQMRRPHVFRHDDGIIRPEGTPDRRMGRFAERQDQYISQQGRPAAATVGIANF